MHRSTYFIMMGLLALYYFGKFWGMGWLILFMLDVFGFERAAIYWPNPAVDFFLGYTIFGTGLSKLARLKLKARIEAEERKMRAARQ